MDGRETGASMMGAYAFIAVALVLLGAVGGFMAVMSLASHRDKDPTTATSSRVARGARVVNGFHARHPGIRHEAAYRHHLHRPNDREW
jgi:hypothetical protein